MHSKASGLISCIYIIFFAISPIKKLVFVYIFIIYYIIISFVICVEFVFTIKYYLKTKAALENLMDFLEIQKYLPFSDLLKQMYI